MPAQSLRPVIAEILAHRFGVAVRDRGRTVAGEARTLMVGIANLAWVEERERVELDDYRDEQIAELDAKVEARDGRIDDLNKRLAAEIKRSAKANSALAALKAAQTP